MLDAYWPRLRQRSWLAIELPRGRSCGREDAGRGQVFAAGGVQREGRYPQVTVAWWIAAAVAMISGAHTATRAWRERSLPLLAFALSMFSLSGCLSVGAIGRAALVTLSAGSGGWISSSLGILSTWALSGALVAVLGGPSRVADLLAMPVLGALSAGVLQAALEHAAFFGARPAVVNSGLPAVGIQLAQVTFYCPGLWRIGCLARQYAGRVPGHHALAGMRAVSVAAVAELVLLVARSAFVLICLTETVRWAGLAVAVIAVAQATVVIVAVAGMIASAWVPVIAAMARQLWLVFAYWRLRPLWAVLLSAVPYVQLAVPLRPWAGLRFRLLRRVIEIRDAELALRSHWRGDIADQARAAARSAGLSSGLEKAVVEAAVVVNAAAARLSGMPPSDLPAEDVCDTSGDDLGAETARLIRVSWALRHCLIVRDVVRPVALPGWLRRAQLRQRGCPVSGDGLQIGGRLHRPGIEE
jgi:hypothetical protein